MLAEHPPGSGPRAVQPSCRVSSFSPSALSDRVPHLHTGLHSPRCCHLPFTKFIHPILLPPVLQDYSWNDLYEGFLYCWLCFHRFRNVFGLVTKDVTRFPPIHVLLLRLLFSTFLLSTLSQNSSRKQGKREFLIWYISWETLPQRISLTSHQGEVSPASERACIFIYTNPANARVTRTVYTCNIPTLLIAFLLSLLHPLPLCNFLILLSTKYLLHWSMKLFSSVQYKYNSFSFFLFFLNKWFS